MSEANHMPKKTEHKHYSIAACQNIKGESTGKELFKILHGREGEAKEVQALVNRINENRGNPGADFIGFCVEKMPELHDITLAEFFNITNKA